MTPIAVSLAPDTTTSLQELNELMRLLPRLRGQYRLSAVGVWGRRKRRVELEMEKDDELVGVESKTRRATNNGPDILHRAYHTYSADGRRDGG
ncbi:hypothetical protein FRC14_008049 [Serendipita sp. 396]|nr:hypothetical protein FRC14_008049 [Serendipita sp. 396]KAG8859268.1 hypothetical protein FRB91_008449 [Serendipita sp. 411]